MQTDYYAMDSGPRKSGDGPWRWSVVDAQGITVDCGRTADQASAVRHARRSALQRDGAYSIAVSNEATEQSSLTGRPHA